MRFHVSKEAALTSGGTVHVEGRRLVRLVDSTASVAELARTAAVDPIAIATSLVEINVPVFVRNSMIMSVNATAQEGDAAPPAEETLRDAQHDEVMRDCD